MKRIMSLILATVMAVGLMPTSVFAVNEERGESVQNPFAGKTISILGDSISTYTGVSNNTSYNSTIGNNAVYYTAGKLDVYQADTWWQQTIDALHLELLVNNAWSGSCILHTRSNTAGAYVDRCVQLHNDKTGETPDIIVVFMGTNDFTYYKSKLGTADIDYDTLIIKNTDGTFTYTTPTTSCEAYAIMLHKMTQRYPDAEIYCMTLLPRRNPSSSGAEGVQPTVFNAELAKIIERYGAMQVDLENCGITSDPTNYDLYIGDKLVHPGPVGMDKMTEALVSAVLGKKAEICDISYTCTGIQRDNPANTALIGGSYKAMLTVSEGYSGMDVTVMMGGKNVTDSVFADGVISIDCVTDDIVITATALKTPEAYRWELDGDTLISSGENENIPTLLGGSVSSGIMSNAYYRPAEQVVLRHDLPWVLEFKASGSWSGMVFSSQKTSSASGNIYLFKTRGTNGFIGFGEYANSQYNNYGVTLSDKGVDTKLEHTYRLENRIAADGSNMVYLLVDNVDYGAMNNYFIAGDNDQKKTVDWLNGKDLFFSYIGASGHAMNKCALDYLQVIECVHNYKSVVTAPTCTEQGYTTYTCACGDSYVADSVDATGHTYENGICTACGEDTVIAVLEEDIFTLTGKLDDGSRIFVAGYDSYDRFCGAEAFTWQGDLISAKIPRWEEIRVFFLNEAYVPVRTFCDTTGNSIYEKPPDFDEKSGGFYVLQGKRKVFGFAVDRVNCRYV